MNFEWTHSTIGKNRQKHVLGKKKKKVKLKELN